MKLTKLMGFAIVLVAMAAVINALAYKTAEVSNGFSLKVQTTQNATLALKPVSRVGASPSNGLTAGFGSNYMVLSMTDVPQPNSVYTYNDVFTIENKASAPVTLSYSFGTALPSTVHVDFVDMADGTTPVTSLLATSSKDVMVKITVDSTYASAFNSDLSGGVLKITANQ